MIANNPCSVELYVVQRQVSWGKGASDSNNLCGVGRGHSSNKQVLWYGNRLVGQGMIASTKHLFQSESQRE